MTPLHDRAAASLLLRSIRILALVNLAPYRRYHKITSIVAVVDQPGQRTVCEYSGQVRTAVGNWITTIPSLIIDGSTETMTAAKGNWNRTLTTWQPRTPSLEDDPDPPLSEH
jgi:hypothetical protein